MGLFEEIGHAWFVVGSQLFLWNYSDTYVSPSLLSQTALMADAIYSDTYALPLPCSWLR
jgi:hypothetical protein